MSNKRARKPKPRAATGKSYEKTPRANVAFGWKHSQIADRLRWWDAGRASNGDWSNLLWLFVFMVFLVGVLPILFIELTGFVMGQGSTFFSTKNASDESDLMLYILLGLGLLAGAYATFKASRRTPIVEFEFDLAAETVRLHEAYFPNRQREIRVPFSAVSLLQIEVRSGGCHQLTLGYERGFGEAKYVSLGFNLPISALSSHLTRLTPQLGTVIQPAVDYSD